MPDFFDSAAAANDKSKASLLAAIATQGSQATAALNQAQQAIQQQRSAALAAALGEGAQRGAPQAVQDQTAATIGTGYDRRLADLASSGASRAGALGNISASAGTYFDEANAALPVLRARQQQQDSINSTSLANRLAEMKAQQDSQTAAGQRELQQLGMTLEDRKQQRDYEKQQREYETALHELQLNVAQANALKATVGADAAASKAATPKAAPNPLTAVGGMSGLQSIVQGATSQVGADGGRALLNPNLNSHQVYDRPKSVADVVAEAAGLPPALVQGVAAQQQVKQSAADVKAADAAQKKADQQADFDPVKVAAKTGISAGKVREIQAADYYKQAAQSVEANLGLSNKDGSPYTREQLLADLNKHFGKYPTTIKVIVAEYADLFPTNAQARGSFA